MAARYELLVSTPGVVHKLEQRAASCPGPGSALLGARPQPGPSHVEYGDEEDYR